MFEFTDIFKPRGYFEARVEIDADTHGMVKGFYTLGIIWTYATTEQEGCVAIVGREDRPVELLTTTTYRGALGIKEKILVIAVQKKKSKLSYLYIIRHTLYSSSPEMTPTGKRRKSII